MTEVTVSGITFHQAVARGTAQQDPRYLFAKQRFNIQSLSLQNLTQAAQSFNLNLTNTLTGQANFTTHIF